MALTPSKTIVFIHGLFVNPKSWAEWKSYFEALGYTCHTPANPCHEGEPADLWRNIDPKLGHIDFQDLVNSAIKFISTLPEKPIVVGHSLGGLVVQKLIAMDLAAAGVCINSAPPLGIITTKWSFWKANFPVINFFKGNSVFLPTTSWFHYAFCNTMSREASDNAFDAFVVPESRNIPRGTLKWFARIDFKKPHEPLLLIAGGADHIVPPSLNWSNFNAYKAPGSVREFKEFPGRGHFTCGAPNWQEVAEYVAIWLKKDA